MLHSYKAAKNDRGKNEEGGTEVCATADTTGTQKT